MTGIGPRNFPIYRKFSVVAKRNMLENIIRLCTSIDLSPAFEQLENNEPVEQVLNETSRQLAALDRLGSGDILNILELSQLARQTAQHQLEQAEDVPWKARGVLCPVQRLESRVFETDECLERHFGRG